MLSVCVCVYVCVWMLARVTNHNLFTQRLVMLHAQTWFADQNLSQSSLVKKWA